jgi:carboxyl-terminal processing protease
MQIFDFIFYLIFSFNLFFSSSFPNFNTSDKDKLLIEIITYVIEKGHYSPKEINDDFSIHVFDAFLESMDGQHRYFLKNDIKELNRYKTEIDDELKSSKIDFFNISYNITKNRIQEVEKFYPSLLENPFDFSIKETTSLDFKKMAYASNLNELKAIWRKRFKLSTLDRFVTKKEQELAKKSKDSFYNIKNDNILEKESRLVTLQNIDDYFEILNELDRKDYFNLFLNAVVTEFDPHTYYFPPKEKELFDTSISGKFEGIGARLSKRKEKVKIVEVILGGPVWKNNLLQVGDEILMVSQPNKESVDISGMRLDDSIKLIKGPKGTKVILTVKRVNGTVENVTIERDIVILEESYAKLL